MSAVALQRGLIVTVVATGVYERLSPLDLALLSWLDLALNPKRRAAAAVPHQNHAVANSFSTVALPWTTSRPLALPKQLGDGIDIALLKQGLQRLIICEGLGAVVLFGSRAQGTARNDSDLDLAVICQEPELTSQQRTQRWRTYRNAIGPLGCGVDLVLQGQADAARLAGSRWHVMKDVARHGVVLYASL